MNTQVKLKSENDKGKFSELDNKKKNGTNKTKYRFFRIKKR